MTLDTLKVISLFVWVHWFVKIKPNIMSNGNGTYDWLIEWFNVAVEAYIW